MHLDHDYVILCRPVCQSPQQQVMGPRTNKAVVCNTRPKTHSNWPVSGDGDGESFWEWAPLFMAELRRFCPLMRTWLLSKAACRITRLGCLAFAICARFLGQKNLHLGKNPSHPEFTSQLSVCHTPSWGGAMISLQGSMLHNWWGWIGTTDHIWECLGK